jgi:AraC-like DNA-binding protein
LKAPTGRFGPLLTWAREHLEARLTVDDLAERAGMSARHFTRAFIAETGTTPSKAIERLRIEEARARVQSSSEAIERVAETTGFRDPERMRRAFIRNRCAGRRELGSAGRLHAIPQLIGAMCRCCVSLFDGSLRTGSHFAATCAWDRHRTIPASG